MKCNILLLGMLLLVSLASATETTCNSCEDCSAKLSGSYDVVKLAVDIANHSGTCIEFNASNVEFDCQGHEITGSTGGQQYYGILAEGKDNIAIKNCVIAGYAINGFAIYLNDTHNSTLNNNTVSDSGEGIVLENSTHNDITNNKINNTNWAIDSWQSSFNRIINNTIFNTTGVEVIGFGNICFAINIMNSNSNLIDNNYVSGTTAADFAVGIYISTWEGSLESADNNIITNNEIYNTIASGTDNPSFGIYAYYSSNNTLTNNTINLNGRGTALLFSSGNTITDNEMSNNAFYGIALHSSSNDNTLTGNTMNNNGHAGIWVYNSSNGNITNNTLESNNDTGIRLSDSNNNTLNSNRACYNTESDFKMYGGSGNSGDYNTCDTTYEWSDEGAARCTYTCSGECIKGDADCDGAVSDFELLDYIDLWGSGEVSDFDLLAAIESWANG